MAEKRAMLCPTCRRLISDDEPACPYCGARRPGAPWKRLLLGGPGAARIDPVTAIIVTNAFFFALSLLINPGGMHLSANPLTFLSPSDGSLFLLGATGTLPIDGYGRWWTLVAASFLHGGLLHLFFNMIALRQLAPFILEAFGPHRFAILYLGSGVAGFAVSYGAGVPFTIGASASLCGLIGAILYYGKHRGGFFGREIYRHALGWVAGLALFGLFFSGINNWAHGGGLLAGIAIAFLTGYRELREETAALRLLGGLSLLVMAAVLGWSLLQAAWLFF